MFSFLKATVRSIIATLVYWWSTVLSIFWQGRFIALVALAYLANEQVLAAAYCIWDYLVANSFCPWIMVFRGRPNGIIIAEAFSHIQSITAASDTSSALSHVFGIGSNIAELVGGPALGVILTAVFVFLSYKSIALIFNKLFNRK